MKISTSLHHAEAYIQERILHGSLFFVWGLFFIGIPLMILLLIAVCMLAASVVMLMFGLL